MLLELFWVKSLSVVVEETKGRLGGLNEENLKRCLGMFAWLSIIEVYGLTTETASFESSSTLGDLKTIFGLIIFKQYNYHCVCTPYVKYKKCSTLSPWLIKFLQTPSR